MTIKVQIPIKIFPLVLQVEIGMLVWLFLYSNVKQVVFKHYMLFTKLNYMEILFIYCFLQLKVKNL